jgi:hypothetical protein
MESSLRNLEGFSDRAILLSYPTAEDALDELRLQGRVLAQWAARFGKHEAQLRYPNPANRCYRVLASMADAADNTSPPEGSEAFAPVLIPGVQAQQIMSLPILKVLTEFLEHPEERRALVRLHDQRQIAMTQSSQVLIKNATVEEAIGRKRESYWFAPDLADFMQRSRRELEPNNPQSSIVVTWRGVDRTGRDWREFTHSYRLLEDNERVLYHCSKNLEFRSIAAPVLR